LKEFLQKKEINEKIGKFFKKFVIILIVTKKPAFGSGSRWIRILLALLDLDPVLYTYCQSAGFGSVYRIFGSATLGLAESYARVPRIIFVVPRIIF